MSRTQLGKQETQRRSGADLSHELGAEAPLVVIPRWDSFHDSRHGVIGVTGPAPTRAHVQDLGQQLGIETEPVSEEHCPVTNTAHNCSTLEIS